MESAPIIYRFKNKKALVVGGGPVGLRRAKKLTDYGCTVLIVTPHIRKEHEGFHTVEEYYSSDVLKEFDIVVAATNDETLNDRIVDDALNENIPLVNSATASQSSTFSFPAVIEEGDIVISISTSGASPAFTKLLKKNLQKILDEELIEHFSLMKEARVLIQAKTNDHNLIKHLGDCNNQELIKIIEKFK